MRCLFELVPGLFVLLTFSDLESTYAKHMLSIWDFIEGHHELWVWMAQVFFFSLIKNIKKIISDRQFKSTVDFFLLCGKTQT